MNRSAGKSILLFISVLSLFWSSCILSPSRKPLNPRILFTVGSHFLENTESLALRGSIDFEDEYYRRESGSFNLIMNRGDSLAFLIEGPFKVDVFRLLLIDQMAYAKNRESDDWTIAAADERLSVPRYGIGEFTPDLLRYLAFPQFYLQSGLIYNSDNSTLSTDDHIFRIHPADDLKSFSLSNPAAELLASYNHRKDLGEGFYPSAIELFPLDQSWKIRLEIDKVKLNPNIPAKIWERD